MVIINPIRKLVFVLFCMATISQAFTSSPQVVHWDTEEGNSLIFIATDSSNNLSSPTHQKIKEVFETEKPDILIMQGFSSDLEGISPDRLKEKGKLICESTGKCQSNLYAAYLATENQVPFVGAEINEAQQISLLAKYGYSREDVIFYLLLRHLPYFYRDGDFETHLQKFTPQTWGKMCTNLLQRNIAGWIKQEVHLTYDDFKAWWEGKFNRALDMMEFSDWNQGTSYHWPDNSQQANYSQKMAFYWDENTDNHLFGLICQHVKKYPKTLIVFHAVHFQNLWDRLIEKFGNPKSQESL